MQQTRTDIAIIGAGAAGLMAAIEAARTLRAARSSCRVHAFDGARTLGAKILVAGGGRCNVTHHEVDERAYAGSSRHAIKQVLRAFGVERTVAFFDERGVTLKQEPTGKLFPTTDSARTVLHALLDAAREADATLVHPWRVGGVERVSEGFIIRHATGHASDAPESILARRVILATGGMSLPKSGSDGAGYAFARALGHQLTPRIFPALVPLLLPDGHFIRGLSGLTLPATLELRSHTGKLLVSFTDSTLCTHFGLSGPSALDISRYLLDHASSEHEPLASLFINWIPGETPERMDRALVGLASRSPLSFLREMLPERLAQAILADVGVEAGAPASRLTRDARRALATALTRMRLPITGDRGFTHAEVTAGGVPLAQLHLATMESRITPGLHLCGEICDVDGRIGGFNFQWAWASGHLAGVAAARALLDEASTDAQRSTLHA